MTAAAITMMITNWSQQLISNRDREGEEEDKGKRAELPPNELAVLLTFFPCKVAFRLPSSFETFPLKHCRGRWFVDEKSRRGLLKGGTCSSSSFRGKATAAACDTIE